MHGAFLQDRITAILSLLLDARRLLAGEQDLFCFLYAVIPFTHGQGVMWCYLSCLLSCFFGICVCYDFMFKVDILFAFEFYHSVCILVSLPVRMFYAMYNISCS